MLKKCFAMQHWDCTGLDLYQFFGNIHIHELYCFLEELVIPVATQTALTHRQTYNWLLDLLRFGHANFQNGMGFIMLSEFPVLTMPRVIGKCAGQHKRGTTDDSLSCERAAVSRGQEYKEKHKLDSKQI